MYKFKSTQLCLKNQIIFTYCFIFQWSLVDQFKYISVQFSSFAQSCLTLCDPMNYSTPGLPIHHQQLESTQIHVHGVGDAINHLILCRLLLLLPSIFLSIRVFKWVRSLHQVAKVLEFQLQHQSSWLLAKKSSQRDQGAYSLLGCAYLRRFLGEILGEDASKCGSDNYRRLSLAPKVPSTTERSSCPVC